MFCPLSAKAASKLVVESLVFGSQPGNLFAVGVDLLPEGRDGCRLVQWSRAGSGGVWSAVAFDLRAQFVLVVEPGPRHLGRVGEPGESDGNARCEQDLERVLSSAQGGAVTLLGGLAERFYAVSHRQCRRGRPRR
jgi:hypothetical protein